MHKCKFCKEIMDSTQPHQRKLELELELEKNYLIPPLVSCSAEPGRCRGLALTANYHMPERFHSVLTHLEGKVRSKLPGHSANVFTKGKNEDVLQMMTGLQAQTGSSMLMSHLKNLFVLFGNIQIAESKSKFIDTAETTVLCQFMEKMIKKVTSPYNVSNFNDILLKIQYFG